MEMLLYQSTQFRDVKKILDRAHGFAGLLTAGGIEASRLDVPFVCDQKVLSRYDDACADIRRILTMQLGLELPKGFSIPLEAEDLAVFFSQQCGLQQMQDYLTQKRERTRADIQTWLRDRPWDTHPVTAAQEAAQRQGVTEVALSLSFTHDVATAMALLVTDEVKPKPKEERDPQRELMSSFKEARSVIDELERLQGEVASSLENAPAE